MDSITKNDQSAQDLLPGEQPSTSSTPVPQIAPKRKAGSGHGSSAKRSRGSASRSKAGTITVRPQSSLSTAELRKNLCDAIMNEGYA